MYQYYFEKLDVWKLSLNFSLNIYAITNGFPDSEKFGLTSQLRRAAVSVPTNIAEGLSGDSAEGLSRDSYKDQARFSTIAYGSLMECLNLLIIANKLNYVMTNKYQDLRANINEIANKLNALKRSQISRSNKL